MQVLLAVFGNLTTGGNKYLYIKRAHLTCESVHLGYKSDLIFTRNGFYTHSLTLTPFVHTNLTSTAQIHRILNLFTSRAMTNFAKFEMQGRTFLLEEFFCIYKTVFDINLVFRLSFQPDKKKITISQETCFSKFVNHVLDGKNSILSPP